MDDTRILLAHGNGGRLMRELIADIFARHLGNPLLDTDADAVTLPHVDGDIMVTTDGFTVEPLEFPGGDIGSLAVHGTVNDLAMCGARPLALTAGFVLEAKSEINANPRDTRDHPKGVWTLPPTYRLKDQDRASYAAIGESDRFTLKFVKPKP